MSESIRVTFMCPEGLLREIEARGDRSRVLREMLQSYLGLLADARQTLAEAFTTEELTLIAALPEEAGQTLQERLYATGEDALARKLAITPTGELAALEDAILRYKRARATGMQVDVGAILK